jgi:hypothetical protein
MKLIKMLKNFPSFNVMKKELSLYRLGSNREEIADLAREILASINSLAWEKEPWAKMKF